MRTIVAVIFVGAACTSGGTTTPRTETELGALLFEDPSLSEPAGEACATCHDPARAFTEPDSDRTT